MSESIYEYIKERISARSAAELYGFEVGRNGMMCCPFHQDRHPSAKVDERFHCFVCGIDGDAVDFTARLFGLSSQDAAKKLAADFGISLPDGRFKKKPPKKEEDPQTLVITDERLLDVMADRVYDVYCGYYRLISKWLLDNSLSSDPVVREYYFEIMYIQSRIEDALDTLLYGSPEEKAQIILGKIGEVNNLERRIMEFETRDKTGVN